MECDHEILDWTEEEKYHIRTINGIVGVWYCPICGLSTEEITKRHLDELIKSGRVIEDEQGRLHVNEKNS